MFGSNLSALRARRRLTQRGLANLLGLPQSTISAYERGAVADPSYWTVVRLASALGVSARRLMGTPPCSR